MPLTDAPKQINLQDIYPPGTPFTITNAWVEGVVPTQYGNRTMAKVMAEPIGAAPGQSVTEYAVWGSLCEQVQGADAGEFPLTVTIVKDGKRFLFKGVDAQQLAAYQAQAQAPAPPSPDEAALGVTPQVQDQGQVAAQTQLPPAPPAPSVPPAAPQA